VHVLLPPSEGKTAPRRGKPLDLAALAYADELGATRERVLTALDAGAALRAAPTAAAAKVYTGVLYQRLGLAELPAPARRRVLIFSGLWGVVRPGDRIPAYKLPIDTPRSQIWRPALRETLPASGLFVDLRSGPYASLWAPRDATVVSVRGFTEQDGRRKAISHMVKATRGDVARLVLAAPRRPKTPEDVAELVTASGARVELNEAKGGWELDVIRSVGRG
jgi:hypothetical protein